MPPEPPPPALGIILISGTHERAHVAFMLATAAAALGRPTTLFATNAGCRALLQNWSGLEGAPRDGSLITAGIAGLEDLRTAAIDLGVRLLACETGLRAAALTQAPLLEHAEIAGLATFLNAVGQGQIVSF